MSDFDGIDKSTGTRALAMEHTPITAETLREAMEAIAAAAPVAPCGSEERPHLTPPTEPGKRVACVSCGERLIVLPNGRAMPEPTMAGFFNPVPLRFTDPAADETLRVPPEYRYTPALDARVRCKPMPVYMGVGFGDVEPPRVLRPVRVQRPPTISRALWRLMRREGRRNFRGRSTKRTDFSARGVPEPELGELVVHACPNDHRYAGPRCICQTRVKVLTARQWRAMERAQDTEQ